MRAWGVGAVVVVFVAGCSGAAPSDIVDGAPVGEVPSPSGELDAGAGGETSAPSTGGRDAAAPTPDAGRADSGSAKPDTGVACVPRSCANLPESACGSMSDGCGGTIACGGCGHAWESCVANVCSCTPKANACPAGSECGTADNGCGVQVACAAEVCLPQDTCGGPRGPNKCSGWFDYCTDQPTATNTTCTVSRSRANSRYCDPTKFAALGCSTANTFSSNGCGIGRDCP